MTERRDPNRPGRVPRTAVVMASLLLPALLLPLAPAQPPTPNGESKEQAGKKAMAAEAPEGGGASVSDQLTTADRVDRFRRGYSKAYTLTLKAGQTYVFDLVSKDFDAYLRLEISTGQEVGSASARGRGKPALLAYSPERSELFRAVVSTLARG